MSATNSATTVGDFNYYLSVLKNNLGYVEDESFKWNDVNGFLIVQLKNTDSLELSILVDQNLSRK